MDLRSNYMTLFGKHVESESREEETNKFHKISYELNLLLDLKTNQETKETLIGELAIYGKNELAIFDAPCV